MPNPAELEKRDAYVRIRDSVYAVFCMAGVVKDHVLGADRLPLQMDLMAANYEDIDAFLRDNGWADADTGPRVTDTIAIFEEAIAKMGEAVERLSDFKRAAEAASEQM